MADFEPILKKERLLIGNPNSHVAVVCLWTRADVVAKKIGDKNKYAVIGNLYSAERGLDIVVRNLLANPKITNLVITGLDFSKSGIVIRDFFEKGFEKGETDLTHKDVWRVKSQHPGYIDLDIPEEALEELRQTVNVVWAPKIEELAFGGLPVPQKRREAKTFEKRDVIDEAKFVGEDAVYVVRGKTIAEVWLKLLDTIMKFGYVSPTHYEDDQKEIMNLFTVIEEEDPNSLFIPEFIPFDKAHIERYITTVLKDVKVPGSSYTYGQRMRSWFGQDQIKAAIEKLAQKPISRAVVISTWDPLKDLTLGGSPCLNHIWLRVRDGRLYMTCIIRSNDMVEGYPENAYGLRALQEHIRTELMKRLEELGKQMDIKLGSLMINSQSAHIYKDSWERVNKILDKYLPQFMVAAQFQRDPRGMFSIDLYGGKIIVHHISPSNEPLGIYEGKTAHEVREQLIKNGLFGNAAHAFYMGLELQKAEMALKLSVPYEQDQPLDFSKTKKA